MGRRGRGPVPKETREAREAILREGVRQKTPVAQLAKAMGVSPVYAYELMKQHGLPLPGGQGGSQPRDEAREAFIRGELEAGKTYREVAESLGLSKQRIEQIAKKRRMDIFVVACGICGKTINRKRKNTVCRECKGRVHTCRRCGRVWVKSEGEKRFHFCGRCRYQIKRCATCGKEIVREISRLHTGPKRAKRWYCDRDCWERSPYSKKGGLLNPDRVMPGTPERETILREGIAQGRTMLDLAAVLGVSQSRVLQLLNERGLRTAVARKRHER